MRYAVCLEEMEGRWIAHVLALPGCFVSDDTREAALALLPPAMQAYVAWRRERGDTAVNLNTAAGLDVEEIIREWVHPLIPDYTVNAFFAADVPPLNRQEIGEYKQLLEWSYADLLAAAHDLPEDVLSRPVEGEWSIDGILNHCSRAEWWYLDRLGLAPAVDKRPANWRERFELAHGQLLGVLPELEGIGRIEVKEGELWSPRKMARRALWHERDHTQHIFKFRARLGV